MKTHLLIWFSLCLSHLSLANHTTQNPLTDLIYSGTISYHNQQWQFTTCDGYASYTLQLANPALHQELIQLQQHYPTSTKHPSFWIRIQANIPPEDTAAPNTTLELTQILSSTPGPCSTLGYLDLLLKKETTKQNNP